jgi:hypothetical protein
LAVAELTNVSATVCLRDYISPSGALCALDGSGTIFRAAPTRPRQHQIHTHRQHAAYTKMQIHATVRHSPYNMEFPTAPKKWSLRMRPPNPRDRSQSHACDDPVGRQSSQPRVVNGTLVQKDPSFFFAASSNKNHQSFLEGSSGSGKGSSTLRLVPTIHARDLK